MSRLDSFLRRMTAQRDSLNWAATAIADVPGDVLECGLGNGRTYDHLRELMTPDRRIWVVERRPKPHPDCWPPADLLLTGEAEESFAHLRAENVSMALIHYDFGTGDAAHAAAEAQRMAALLAPLVAPSGILLASQDMPLEGELTRLDPKMTGGGTRVRAWRRPPG